MSDLVRQTEVLVVGGGIAGVSAAAHFAGHAETLLLERESALGYHSSGRSATFYHFGIGNDVVRGLTAASSAADGWQEAYGGLIGEVAQALSGVPIDLTVELITHRYTAASRAVLTSWYPGSSLDMSADRRAEKRTKFGSVKHVYDAPTMKALKSFFEERIAAELPQAQILYFT